MFNSTTFYLALSLLHLSHGNLSIPPSLSVDGWRVSTFQQGWSQFPSTLSLGLYFFYCCCNTVFNWVPCDLLEGQRFLLLCLCIILPRHNVQLRMTQAYNECSVAGDKATPTNFHRAPQRKLFTRLNQTIDLLLLSRYRHVTTTTTER